MSPTKAAPCRGEVVDDVAARVPRRVEDRRAMPAERHDVAVAHGYVDARNARRIGARADDRATRPPLELEVAAGVIGVVMGVEDVGQAPALRGELYRDLARHPGVSTAAVSPDSASCSR